jgi:hypothetical protein
VEEEARHEEEVSVGVDAEGDSAGEGPRERKNEVAEVVRILLFQRLLRIIILSN